MMVKSMADVVGLVETQIETEKKRKATEAIEPMRPAIESETPVAPLRRQTFSSRLRDTGK